MADLAQCGIIWDVDGTLVDTAELHFEAWRKLAGVLRKPFTRADFNATFGRRNPDIIHQLFGPQYSDQEVADLGARKEEYYKTAARLGVTLLPGVRSLLETLHQEKARQAIASSAPRANLDLVLSLARIARFFEVVVSMEDTERGKPDPQVFLVAAGKLGVPSARCLVLEDAVAGVQAAKTGRMKCIAVRYVGHHPEEVLRAAGADLVVNSLADVSVETVRRLLQ